MQFFSLILAAAFAAVVVADDNACNNLNTGPLACSSDSDCINAGCDDFYCSDIDALGFKSTGTYCQLVYTD
ncbi:hypothetical protein N7540_000986 [Penicillium herquei]|nr:hypothetical protein N7540_000986 [Penicillium herquei]